MARNHKDWISAFLDYSSYAESPKEMRFWAGVSAVAGALRRKVWIDQRYFIWYPNFYVIFVAPPGIVSKSTTADMSMSLLKEVPGIRFGPDVVTWPALVQAFAGACESFEIEGEFYPMSALTLVASELGNLINPQDRELVNLYIDLWDGRKSLEKVTKTSGSDLVEAPWINMIGCTTPHWIADNMPPAIVGGGFTSRCIFVYADKKEKYVAYPRFAVANNFHEQRLSLIQDLEHISSTLAGEYELTPKAIAWGETWYEELWKARPLHLVDEKLDGYVARKQTHLHKLAMVMAASQRDELYLTEYDLMLAQRMLESVEQNMSLVFSRIGKSEASLQVEAIVRYVNTRGAVPMEEAMRHLYDHFPDARDMDGIVSGMVRAGYIDLQQRGSNMYLAARKVPGDTPPPQPGNKS